MFKKNIFKKYFSKITIFTFGTFPSTFVSIITLKNVVIPKKYEKYFLNI